jgi:hypothetical protein
MFPNVSVFAQPMYLSLPRNMGEMKFENRRKNPLRVSKYEHRHSFHLGNLFRTSSSQGDEMNSMISDVALDLGVFALDGDIGNRAIIEVLSFANQSWSSSAAGDPARVELLAFAR